jgi:hypothetical protein
MRALLAAALTSRNSQPGRRGALLAEVAAPQAGGRATGSRSRAAASSQHSWLQGRCRPPLVVIGAALNMARSDWLAADRLLPCPCFPATDENRCLEASGAVQLATATKHGYS